MNTAPLKKSHVKRNDEVKILSGAQKGKTGKVLQVLRSQQRVLVEGVNVRKKAVKPTQENPKGGFEEKEASLHLSNVRVIKATERKKPSKK
ncbi:MAG: 50S ribosomal protein L24 [Candidatus Methylacidiphilales bacterium]